MQEQMRNVQPLDGTVYLLVHILRAGGRQSNLHQPVVYPLLVDILRNKQPHSIQVVQMVVEAVAIIAKQGAAGCSILVDLGVVT